MKIVPAAIGAALATEVRSSLANYTRYTLIDRGSYDFVDDPALPELHEVLAGIASGVTSRELEIVSLRALRLRPGDYLLTRHDRVYEDRPVELVLDISAAPVAGAEVHWRHRGQVFFVMPSAPGSLAVVERGPTVMCNHTYVSKLCTGDVVRIVALAHEPTTIHSSR
jgi:hypothetical protein